MSVTAAEKSLRRRRSARAGRRQVEAMTLGLIGELFGQPAQRTRPGRRYSFRLEPAAAR
jgi:hypothetical protein